MTRQVLSGGEWVDLSRALGSFAALAPDGSSMILPVTSMESGTPLLGLKMRESATITPLADTESAQDVRYSPDGRAILYRDGSNLVRHPLVGGTAVTLASELRTSGTVGIDWLDDGTVLYEEYTGQQARPWRLNRVSAGGGEPLETVLSPDTPFAVRWVHGLPGGQGALVIECTGFRCPAERTRLSIVNLQSSSFEPYLDQVIRAWYTETGHLVYVDLDGTVFAQPFDPNALEPAGPAVVLFEGVQVTRNASLAVPNMVLGADGTLLYVEAGSAKGAGDLGNSRLVVVDRQGNEELLPLSPRRISWPVWSPDGRTVAYQSGAQIYTFDVELGTTPRQVSSGGANIFPYFSPDGGRIAYSKARGGRTDLFVRDLARESSEELILDLEGTEWLTQWPSDTLLLFEWIRDASTHLGVLDLPESGDPEADVYISSEAALFDLVVSPDGGLAAYRSAGGGTREIYVRAFPEPREGIGITGDVPFWSPDGGVFYYWRDDGDGLGTFLAAHIRQDPELAVSSTDSLFSGVYGRPASGAGLHPDGDRWILTKPEVALLDSGAEAVGKIVLVQNWFTELCERMGDF